MSTAEDVRSTQRAPRSCVDCSRRKVKCNKRMPCDVCIRRGRASTCAREKVKVRGRVMDAVDESAIPLSYEELVQENEDLKARLNSRSCRSSHSPEYAQEGEFVLNHSLDAFEEHLFESLRTVRQPSTVSTESDVEFPSRPLSEFLLSQGQKTTSWAHFALHHPTFETEHDIFWESCSSSGQHAQYDPFWLALYFSFLSAVVVYNEDVAPYVYSHETASDSSDRLRKWYDSAIFYLHRAQFLRVPDLRTVQSIAILTNVFKISGDFTLYQTMLPIAIRTAQILKINHEVELATRDVIEQEVCRRVWWTLVICEWLPIPYRDPCVREDDFQVDIPIIRDDDELGASGSLIRHEQHPRPIHYHIAMIEAARVYRHFRSSLKDWRLSQSDVVKLVGQADEALAQIIMNLPPYLRAEFDSGSSNCYDETIFPWISRQRISISLVLLNLRMNVNKVLQNIWSDQGTLFRRARSICLGSSNTMLSLILEGQVPRERLNTWGLVSHLFSAAVTLSIEAELSGDVVLEDNLNPVLRFCELLRTMQMHNRVAGAALKILETLVTRT